MDMAAASSTFFNPTSLSHKPLNLRTNLKIPSTNFSKFNIKPLTWSSSPLPTPPKTLVPHCSTTSKRIYQKSKRSSTKRLPPIGPGDRIDYRNVSLLSRFISEQGKILSRKVNRLTLKQQRLITSAIKQARILSLLPFLNVENQFERADVIPRATGPRGRSK